MSRTVRNRSRSGDLNKYARHVKKTCFSSFHDESERMENFIIFYRRDGSSEGVPRSFRKSLNKTKKAKDKQTLFRAILNDKLDNLITFKDVKNAAYLYW